MDRASCYKLHQTASSELSFDKWPLQLGMGKCPWRVAVASIVQVQNVLQTLLYSYPTPAALANANLFELALLLRPCGLHHRRARTLIAFSCQWLGEWHDLRDLTGVGPYVADAVGLFCFGCTELVTRDEVLTRYIKLGK